MRDSSTRCTHTKCFDLHVPRSAPHEKLEFVEHVLGVLIESRYGKSNPYSRLGEQPVTTGHSQMFANISLLSAAEIEERLRSSLLRELPLGSRPEDRPSAKAVANGASLSDRSGFSPKAAWAKGWEIVAAITRRLNPTAIPLDRASSPFLQTNNLARGSPDISGTLFFACSFASLASFA